MKIKTIRIENLRCIKDQTIPIGGYTSFVGPNGCGKSTVLFALNIFFRESQGVSTSSTRLEKEDFYNHDTSKPIAITLTFDGITPDEQEDLKDYARGGELVVTVEAIFDANSGIAEVKQFGQRLGIKLFAPFFELEKAPGTKVGDIKPVFDQLKEQFQDLPAWRSREQAITSLREHETARPHLCELLRSSDQFYGFNGVGKLERHIQWVYVPAVKDATEEQVEGRSTAIGKLVARRVREAVNFEEQLAEIRMTAEERYQVVLDGGQAALDGLSISIQGKLRQWGHQGVTARVVWGQEPGNAIKIAPPLAYLRAGEFGLDDHAIARLGHGMQRSLLLTLLQELATNEDGTGPKLILGIEEPELYQHPPQARHLHEVLRKLASDPSDAQVLVTTHSPYFVSGEAFEDIRVVRRSGAPVEAKVTHTSFAVVAADLAAATGNQPEWPDAFRVKLHQELQIGLNEVFFGSVIVLVEGLEDVAYLTAHLMLSGKWEQFRTLGCHIVPANGKGHMPRPLAVLKRLDVPSFVVFDADGDKLEKDEHRRHHEHENKALLAIAGIENGEPFPTNPILGDAIAVWPTDLGKVVEADFEAIELQRFKDAARTACGHAGGLQKNHIFIGEVLLAAKNEGKESKTLAELCDAILAFAKKSAVGPETPPEPISAELIEPEVEHASATS